MQKKCSFFLCYFYKLDRLNDFTASNILSMTYTKFESYWIWSTYIFLCWNKRNCLHVLHVTLQPSSRTSIWISGCFTSERLEAVMIAVASWVISIWLLSLCRLFSEIVSTAVARTLIGGGGCLFIYACSARLVSFEIKFKFINLKRNWSGRTWIYE